MKTDWESYYTRPYRTATYSRRIMSRMLLKVMQRYSHPGCRIVELGGANSCFFEDIKEKMRPSEYHIIDNNCLGLDFLKKSKKIDDTVFFYQQDVLRLEADITADLVFSVGLIEHFDYKETAEVIQSHFRLLKPGGLAIISFPTPTWLYRFVRSVAEITRQWIFFDERPLKKEEVADSLRKNGEIIFTKTIWPMILTQRLTVTRKC
jgi:SAM-dependent methyltransferase